MAYAPHELVEKWRRDAKKADERVGIGVGAIWRQCADELERYHHDNEHDAYWEADGSCPICIKEMAEQEPAKPCKGFQWIGQPMSSCDRCGLPFWEHTHEEKLDREKGPFAEDAFYLEPIPADRAAAVKARWGG